MTRPELVAAVTAKLASDEPQVMAAIDEMLAEYDKSDNLRAARGLPLYEYDPYYSVMWLARRVAVKLRLRWLG